MEFFSIYIDWRWDTEEREVYVGKKNALAAFEARSSDPNVENMILYECHVDDNGEIKEIDAYCPIKTFHN